MKIAVILPSRGLLYSQTADEILQNLEGKQFEIYFAHDLPIPDCFNKPIERALADKSNSHFWFVEEDMVLPTGILDEMLAMKAWAAAADYPVTANDQGSVAYDPAGLAFFTGTGCLLVRRAFLEEYKHPIFRSDIQWLMKSDGATVELTPTKAPSDVYGYHDVNFGLLAYLRNHPIKIVKTTVGQRRMVKRGENATNQGGHEIEEWRGVKSPRFFEIGDPKAPDATLNVTLSDGKTVLMPRDRAESLAKDGLARVVPEGPLRIVRNELSEAIL